MQIPHPFDPNRPPDWRFCRCHYLAERGESPTRRDDAATVRGWRYLSLLSRCGTEEQRDQLACENPELHAAHTLRGRPDDLRRVGAEGYLLAGVFPEEIDGRFEFLPGTSRCYMEQFFDVQGCLGAPDYIINVVIGLHSRELTVRDAEVFIRLYGFLGGRYVVDAFLDYFYAPLWLPLLLKRVTREELEQFRQRLQVHLTILMDCVPEGSTTLRQWLALTILLKRAKHRKPPEWSGLRVSLFGLLPASAMSSQVETTGFLNQRRSGPRERVQAAQAKGV